MSHKYPVGVTLYHKKLLIATHTILSVEGGRYDLKGHGTYSNHSNIPESTIDDIFYVKSAPVIQLEDSLFTA